MIEKRPQKYSNEEAREILQRAAAYEVEQLDRVDADELRAMAEQSGISEDALARAEQDWIATRGTIADASERAEFEKYRRMGFVTHTGFFVLMNLFLLVFSLSMGQFWFIFPLLGWGVGLFSHWMSLRRKEGHLYENEFMQWKLAHPTPQRQLPPPQ